VDPKQLKQYIIEPVLRELGLDSKAATQLLMLTAAQESSMGKHIHQVGGPALGIFQMEPATHDDIWENFLKYKPDLWAKAKALSGSYPVVPPASNMIWNLNYAAVMCRIHYYRVSQALPDFDDIEGMATYWKQHYNTIKGKGHIREAVDNYHRYVK